jgi:polysaccharide export outer membrane protein
MKGILKNIIKTVVLASVVFMASCIPQKKILYFQDRSESDSTQTEFLNERAEDYRIQPGDNLFIRVDQPGDRGSTFERGMAANFYTEAGLYINSYSVNDSGYVNFPLIGRVLVQEKTIADIKEELQVMVDEYVKNSIVQVKLVNFRVSMLGEFKQPGKYIVYQDNITIFQAISMAGDLTDFAKRDRIVLIRQTENGSKLHRLDLNDQNILSSDYFYLMPNDIVYAEPIKGKAFVFSEFPYALFISVITLGVVLYTAVQ